MNVTLLTEKEAEMIAERSAYLAYERAREELFQPTPAWMTLKELCAYVQLSETKVRDLIRHGLPCSNKGGDKRFYRPDVDNWMRGQL